MNPAATDLSIVITAYNEAPNIASTLLQLEKQINEQQINCEILVVDDCSTDRTGEVVGDLGLSHVHLLKHDRDLNSPLTTRQQALDFGFNAAKGNIIATLDADSGLPEGWISKLVAPIHLGKADAVAGPIAFFPLDSWVARWQNCDAAFYYLLSFSCSKFANKGGVQFGNFAFERNIYANIGGFERLGLSLTEDLELGFALQRAGKKILFEPGVGPVQVKPCGNFPELLDRCMRVSTSAVSALTIAASVWYGSFLILLIAALWTMQPVLSGLFAIRVLTSVGLIWFVQRRWFSGTPDPMAFVHDSLAIGVAIFVLLRKYKKRPVLWGGKRYRL